MGPSGAPVTLVEFFDPSCETCRSFYPLIKQLMARHPKDLRVVLRYAPFHKGSDEAVRILLTARLQGKFEPVLEALLADQPQWASHEGAQLDRAWATAEKAGLDLAKARQAAGTPEVAATLAQDVEDGKWLKVSKTPTFFVNGKPLPSFGVEELYELVKAEVAAAR